MPGNEARVGYVINNYSSSGMVQVQFFGHDDGCSDPSQNCKWAYVDQGCNNLGVGGVGENHTLQSGCRVKATQFGGADGSYVVGGPFGRMGSGGGATSYGEVDASQTDWCVPLVNPGTPNGVRCQAKPPNGQYHQAAGGQPLDMSQSQYPITQFRNPS